MNENRRYRQSHSWLTFNLDLEKANAEFWMLLGEAASKCDHIAGVPLLPDVARDLHTLYLAKGVLATTAIEGNTLTEGQVLQQLQGQLILPASQQYLAQEIDNVSKALDTLAPAIIDGTLSALDPSLIKKMNLMVLARLPLEKDVRPGEIRDYEVTVGNYRGAPPEDCEFLLDRLCTVLNETGGEGFSPIAIGIIKAMFAHLYLAWIHPFGDGNGRTSRLLEFFILLAAGVSTPTAHLLSNHYNQTRIEYYRQLDYASKSGGNIMPFLHYALKGLVEGLKTQIKRIREHQLDLIWQYYIYEQFKEKNLDAEKRRRDLLIEISKEKKPVWIQDIKKLNVRIAITYAHIKDRTLNRDLSLLEQEGFLELRGGKARARKELIESFLPESRLQVEQTRTPKPRTKQTQRKGST
jgi:Fic family protein